MKVEECLWHNAVKITEKDTVCGITHCYVTQNIRVMYEIERVYVYY